MNYARRSDSAYKVVSIYEEPVGGWVGGKGGGGVATYEGPHARVIGVPLNNQITRASVGARRHDHDIASLRILRTNDCLFICLAKPAVEDLHVVVVKVNLGGCQSAVQSIISDQLTGCGEES